MLSSLTAKEFVDLVQHLPGNAAPIVDEDIHTQKSMKKSMRRRSKMAFYDSANGNSSNRSNSKQEAKDKDKEDGDSNGDGDYDDPCKDDICVVEYPTPINCDHSNDKRRDGSSSRSNDDVYDCRIKVEQDNLTYSGQISEGRYGKILCVSLYQSLYSYKNFK